MTTQAAGHWSVEGTAILRSPPLFTDSAAWSTDNQLLVCTANALYIVTPQCKTSRQQLSTPMQKITIFPLGVSPSLWQKSVVTSIDTTKSRALHNFPRPTTDLVARGSEILPESYRSAVWSPRGCSRYEGCLLLALSNSHRLQLFEPLSVPSLSSWQELMDLTAVMLQHYRETRGIEPNTVRVDGTQLDFLETTAIAWSNLLPRVNDSALRRPSLIALGNKAKEVTIWKFLNNEVQHAHAIQACFAERAWVNRLAWSPWIADSDRQWHAFLAIVYSIGLVEVHRVTAETPVGEADAAITSSLCRLLFRPNDRIDRGVVSIVQWISQDTRSSKLFIAKASHLYLWDVSAFEEYDPDTAVSAKAKCIPHGVLVGGIAIGADNSTLTAYMVNGNTVVVDLETGLTEEPTLSKMALHPLLAKHGALPQQSDTARRQAKDGVQDADHAEVDEEETGADEENDEDDDDAVDQNKAASLKGRQLRFYGGVNSPSGLMTALVYTVFNPEHLTFVTEKSNRAYLDVLFTTSLGDANIEADILTRMSELLSRCDFLYGYSLDYLTWDVVQYIAAELQQTTRTSHNDSFLDRTLDMLTRLYEEWSEEEDLQPDQGADAGAGLGSVGCVFRRRLYESLSTNALRALTAVLSRSLPLQNDPGADKIQQFLATYSQTLMGEYIRHSLDFINTCVTVGLSDFEVRIEDRCLNMIYLFASFLMRNDWQIDIGEEIAVLANITDALLQRPPLNTQMWQTHHLEAWSKLLGTKDLPLPLRDLAQLPAVPEVCPACLAPITSSPSSYATCLCENGHHWASMNLIAIPSVRGCMGCNRKALLPDNDLGESSDLLSVMLHLNAYCSMCGDRFCWRGRLRKAPIAEEE
ncbi:hypothetical protein RI367_001878 [Sorochytrium milnesiophthora]